MPSGKKPPWFAQQEPSGPIPLASFEEDLFDTASEDTASPESEYQNELPPLPSLKPKESTCFSDDNESQDGTITPKSSATHSKEDLLTSSRDELSTEEFESALTSPKTPTVDSRSSSPFSALFRWRSSSPHGSPRKSRDSSPSKSSSSHHSQNPSTPLKSPKSPKWRREGKAFLSLFKFGEKKRKTNLASPSKSDAPSPSIEIKSEEEPDIITCAKASPPYNNYFEGEHEIPSPSNQSECRSSDEIKEEDCLFNQIYSLDTINEKTSVSSDGFKSVADDIESVNQESIKEQIEEVDIEAENLLSHDSVDFEDVPELLSVSPTVNKVQPVTPTRKQRLEVVTIPVERPRSNFPMSVAPLEAFILAIKEDDKAENLEKIKLSLPGEEFIVKERQTHKAAPKQSWVNFCESGLHSPRLKKKLNSIDSFDNENGANSCTDSNTRSSKPDWVDFDVTFDDLISNMPKKCNCLCSIISTSAIASVSFEDNHLQECRCSCHNGANDDEICECNCSMLAECLPINISNCDCYCHQTTEDCWPEIESNRVDEKSSCAKHFDSISSK